MSKVSSNNSNESFHEMENDKRFLKHDMGGNMEGLDERGCEEKDTGTR